MTTKLARQHFTLPPNHAKRLKNLCEENGKNIALIEAQFGVEITSKNHQFIILGLPKSIAATEKIIQSLYRKTVNQAINKEATLQEIKVFTDPKLKKENIPFNVKKLQVGDKFIAPRTPNQQHYLKSLHKYDINFCIGPSGTGKKFLAIASAIADYDAGYVTQTDLPIHSTSGLRQTMHLLQDIDGIEFTFSRPMISSDILWFSKLLKPMRHVRMKSEYSFKN